MLLCGEQGPFVDRFQRGEFSDSEIGTLAGLYDAIAGPADAPVALPTSAYVAGRRAITTLNSIFGALPIWARFDASVRIFASFGKRRINKSQACDARAFELNVPQSAPPTFGIHVNLDSLPVLHDMASVLLRDAFPPLVLEAMPQPPAGRDAMAFLADTGAFHATLLILLHEIGHILRGHLGLIGEAGMSEGVDEPLRTTAANGAPLRRALEVDADLFAARLYGAALRATVKERDVAGEFPSVDSYFVAGLFACYAMFSALARDGAYPTPFYHSPLARLNAIAQTLGGEIGIDPDRSKRFLVSFLGVVWESKHAKRDQFATTVESNYATYAKDSEEMTQTLALREQLQAEEKLRGWFLEARTT